MGFYGKVTNLTNASLNFDKIYPNKFFMNSSIDMDSILIGRYVLVEYDTQGFYPEVTTDGTNWYFLSQSTPIKFLAAGIRGFLIDSQENLEKVYQQDIDKNYIYENEIVIKKVNDDWEFYKSNGENFIYITTISNAENLSTYDLNYELDKKTTDKFSKPFDSTVYVKTKKDGVIQYLAIAELNSVVPSFEIVPIAPTENPNVPEFEKQSNNNVLYKLKVQPSWGFRIAMNEDYSDVQIERTRINDSGDTEYYNNSTNEWTTEKATIPAAIYFNSDGFDPEKSNTIDITSPNTITVRPTGKSGNKYIIGVNEKGEPIEEEAPDIQELSISLPIIGNTISKVWDVVYGENRDSSEDKSLAGKFNAINEVKSGKILIKSNDNKLIGLDVEDDNNWISTSFSDDKSNLTISHKINEKLQENNKLQELDYYENQDDINENTILIPTPIIDKAGHVIGYNKTAAKIEAGDKINIENVEEDGIEISHEIIPDNGSTIIHQFSLKKPKKSEYKTDEEYEEAFSVWQDRMSSFSTRLQVGFGEYEGVDKYGHVYQIYKTKYSQLPFQSFSTIKNEDNTKQIVADYSDELNLKTDNLINIDIEDNETENNITVSHAKVDAFSKEEANFNDKGEKTLSLYGINSEANNIIDLGNNNSFTTYQLTINDAGHIVGFIPYTIQCSGSSWIEIV